MARLARALGEPARLRMLTLLMEGRALTAKEMAYGAGVEPATGTWHLRKLEDAGLVSVAAQGRHKYFRLASRPVARAVEALMAVAPRDEREPLARPLHDPVRVARFCYDHLAGALGTGLAEVLASRGLLRPQGEALCLTVAGEAWCRSFGIGLAGLRRQRRRFAYACLDWSERRNHVGGALGAAIAERIVSLGWIARKRDSRVVLLTAAGKRGLRQSFGLKLPG